MIMLPNNHHCNSFLGIPGRNARLWGRRPCPLQDIAKNTPKKNLQGRRILPTVFFYAGSVFLNRDIISAEEARCAFAAYLQSLLVKIPYHLQSVWDTCSKYFYPCAIHFPPQATPTILLVEAFSSLSKWSHFDLLLKKRSHVGCCPEKSLKKLKKIEKMWMDQERTGSGRTRPADFCGRLCQNLSKQGQLVTEIVKKSRHPTWERFFNRDTISTKEARCAFAASLNRKNEGYDDR